MPAWVAAVVALVWAALADCPALVALVAAALALVAAALADDLAASRAVTSETRMRSGWMVIDPSEPVVMLMKARSHTAVECQLMSAPAALTRKVCVRRPAMAGMDTAEEVMLA